MTEVTGKNRANRPYFFREVGGDRMEIPSFGVGSGDLEGGELVEFQMYVRARQIEYLGGIIPPEEGELTFGGEEMVFDGEEMEFS